MAHAGGRPKIEIDFETVEKLCQMQCTGEEIASFLNVDYDTLEKRIKTNYHLSFSEYIKKNSENGKCSLRRQQWKLAMADDRTMLIWLGKQYLGQTDKLDNSVAFPKGDFEIKVTNND